MIEEQTESLHKKVAKYEKMRKKSLAKQLEYLVEKVNWESIKEAYHDERMILKIYPDGSYAAFDRYKVEGDNGYYNFKSVSGDNLKEFIFEWWKYYLRVPIVKQ